MSLLSRKRGWKWFLFGFGVVLGAIPDALQWFIYQIGAGSRWGYWYDLFHHHITWWDILPPVFLHYLVDLPFHPYPGYDWGSNWVLVVLDVALLIFAIVLGIYSFTVRTETT